MNVKMDDRGWSTFQTSYETSKEMNKWMNEMVVVGPSLCDCSPDFSAHHDHVTEGRYWKYETFGEFVDRICGV